MAKAGIEGWRRRMARVCRLRTVRRLYASERASAGVEFALVGIPFFLVLFAIFETALCLWAGQVLDTATAASARLILTGQVQTKGVTKEQFKQDLCARVRGLIDCQAGVMIDVQTYQTWNQVDVGRPVDRDTGNVNVTGQRFNVGQPGSIVVVRAVYEYPILMRTFGLDLADLPSGKRLIVSTVAFQNEPFAETSSAQ